jgi:hypothetical protein
LTGNKIQRSEIRVPAARSLPDALRGPPQPPSHLGKGECRTLSELGGAALLLLLLLAGSGLGMLIRPLLSERHRSRETTDLIQLVLTMLVTFAALVLGLLTSSAKASFDQIENDLRSMSIQLIQLDRSLRELGGETDRTRALLRAWTAARIAATWTDEPRPPGNYYPTEAHGRPINGMSFGDFLNEVESNIRRIEPQNPTQLRLLTTCINQFEVFMRARWKVIEEGHSSISMPFYIVLTLWLLIIFAGFGLSAPINGLSGVMIALGALSIASVVFVILDLDTPYTGFFMVSSQPLREALMQLSQ